MNLINDCPPIRELLVEYADGELSPADRERVARHIEHCQACRHELRLLQRSLELARDVWQEAAAGECRVRACTHARNGTTYPVVCVRASTHPTGRATRQTVRWAILCAAASVLFLVTAGMWMTMKPIKRKLHQAANVAAKSDLADPSPAPATNDDIERYIAREASAARLAASAAILSAQPGLEEYRRRAERYIIENYGDTTAGRELAGRSAPKPIKEPQS